MDALEVARDELADIAGVASCRIGLEANISPADYPLIRIVPTRLTPGRPYSRRTIEAQVYIGWDTSEAEGGLEAVYTDLLALEQGVRDTIQALGGRYIETITDEDRLDTYKLMALRVELPAVIPPPVVTPPSSPP